MNDHLRRLTVFIDEPDHGHFHWVLIESTGDAAVWDDIDSSDEAFPTWQQAWEAGTVALMAHIDDPLYGPRAAGEDENASPVG